MTHIFLMTEGFPNGIENFISSIRKHCQFIMQNGSPKENGKKAGVSIREIRFWDITVKQEHKKEFLGQIKKHTKVITMTRSDSTNVTGLVLCKR
jgi:hypothetical protein